LTDLAAGDYTAVVTDLAGCTIESEAITISAPEAIEGLAVASDVLCAGDENGMIDVSSQGGTGELTYSIDGENFGSEVLFDELAGGDYTITVMDENGCEATFEATVGEPEALAIVVESVTDDAGEGGAIDITVSGGTGELTIDWEGPNAFTADTEDIDGLEPGDYTVTVTDENGCEISSDIVQITVGLDKILAGIEVSIMPNPSNGIFVVNIDAFNGERMTMRILDAMGRIVVNEQINGNGNIRRDIDLTDQADGFYFLQLNVEEEFRTIKLIKQ
jgi:hypothetical protein